MSAKTAMPVYYDIPPPEDTAPSAPPAPPGWNFGQKQHAAPPPPPSYNFAAMNDAAEAFDVEGQGPKGSLGFDDRTIRVAFIRKVFTLVTVMLLVVAVMTSVPFFHEGTRLFLFKNQGFVWLAYIIFLVVYIAVACVEPLRRSFPINLVMTAIFTLAVGYMSTVITARYKVDTVLLALIITTVCCASVVIFASQTKIDLTAWMWVVCILGVCLIMFGFVASIATYYFKMRFIYSIYALGVTILFMVYLAIDVQMLMGGKKYEISPEDHIFAAMQIFLDIIQIFWHILAILGRD